VVVYNVG
jgi:hypothetical protein